MPGALEELLRAHPDRVLLRAVSGSQAYGLATAQSDVDERGVFALPASAYVALRPPRQHVDQQPAARGAAAAVGAVTFGYTACSRRAPAAAQ